MNYIFINKKSILKRKIKERSDIMALPEISTQHLTVLTTSGKIRVSTEGSRPEEAESPEPLQ